MSRGRGRRNERAELIYGLHAVESILKNNPLAVLQLWLQKGRRDKRLHNIARLAEQNQIHIEQVATDRLDKKAEGAVHQGVVAKVRPVAAKTVSLEQLCERDSLLLLVLDEVQDPHNIGACLRTADAVGADAVIVSKNRSPGLTAVVRKVSSGAADTVPFVQVSNLARALQTLRDNDVWILGAAGEADAGLYDCQVADKTALVMGSEGKGMRRLTREHCDQLIAIPMHGSVESLNVSVATGVCLYHIRRQMNAQQAG